VLLRDASSSGYLCPVCLHPIETPHWQAGGGSHEICSSCGIHFGYNDAHPDLRARVYDVWRRAWIARGRRALSGDDWRSVSREVIAVAAGNIEGPAEPADAAILRTEFLARCRRIADVDATGPGGYRELEPLLVEFVQFCRPALGENRDALVHLFDFVLRTEDAIPDEFFEYAVHVLRFRELPRLVRGWIGETDPDSRAHRDRQAFLERVELAYREDWPDAVLWESLSVREHR